MWCVATKFSNWKGKHRNVEEIWHSNPGVWFLNFDEGVGNFHVFCTFSGYPLNAKLLKNLVGLLGRLGTVSVRVMVWVQNDYGPPLEVPPQKKREKKRVPASEIQSSLSKVWCRPASVMDHQKSSIAFDPCCPQCWNGGERRDSPCAKNTSTS